MKVLSFEFPRGLTYQKYHSDKAHLSKYAYWC